MEEAEMSAVISYTKPSIYNVQTASYHGERPDPRSFSLFLGLPPEIRIKIWHCAISIPRIEEVLFDKNWNVKNTIPRPSLLYTCRESRRECLSSYNTKGDLAGQEWIRFDKDILFFKHLDFCDMFARPNFEDSVQRWASRDQLEAANENESDKWVGRPRSFEKVHILAINREVLTQTWDDYECIIRHFFPSLKLLVVLIDDGIAIDKAWNIKNGDFEVYEADWGDFPPRWDFTKASTAPFTTVSVENTAYKEYIEKEMKKRFEREEKDYKGYAAPALCVMGCWLPPGMEIPECGRWPDDWSGDVRTLV